MLYSLLKQHKKRIGATLLACFMLNTVFINSASAIDTTFYDRNGIYYYNSSDRDLCDVSTANGIGIAKAVGDTVFAKAWNWLVTEGGLTPIAAAGVLGNMRKESGDDSNNKLDMLDINVQEEKFAWPAGGWGLIQWTKSRRDEISSKLLATLPDVHKVAYTAEYSIRASGGPNRFQKEHPDLYDKLLIFELSYMKQESQNRTLRDGGKTKEWDGLNQTKTPEEAARFFQYNAERSGDDGDGIARRERSARLIYDTFQGQPVPSSTATAQNTAQGTAPTVLLDPGHGASLPPYVDPATGLQASETNNQPEGDNVFSIAQIVQKDLKEQGYNVILSRNDAVAPVTFRQRSDIAKDNKASIGVSLHTDTVINGAWSQSVNRYREFNGKKVTFSNQETAQKSQNYAKIFAETRSKPEYEATPIDLDLNATVQSNSFGATRESIGSKGNIPLVSLFSESVPWVYNEIKNPNNTPFTEVEKTKIAKGFVESIKQAVPFSPQIGATAESSCGTSGGGDIAANQGLAATTLAYASHQYHPSGYRDFTPAYDAAVKAARKNNEYVGGLKYPGVDCGGFTTRLIINSGFDKGFNYGAKISAGAGYTVIQEEWMKNNWQLLGTGSTIDAATMKPGDVAINNNHTFIYVGDIPGFDSKIASASLDERSPMAGKESITNGEFRWYRKK